MARWTAAALALALTAATPALAEPETFSLDPSHVHVGFEATHFGFAPVQGRFNTVSGTLTLDPEDPAAAALSVTIDAASVDSSWPARDRHLMSDDFLAAEAHPQITFVSTDVTLGDDGHSGQVTGDLTLRGVTLPITLDVQLLEDSVFPFNNLRTLSFSAEGTLLRSDFGSTYALPDAVGDEVRLILLSDFVLCGDTTSVPACTSSD